MGKTPKPSNPDSGNTNTGAGPQDNEAPRHQDIISHKPEGFRQIREPELVCLFKDKNLMPIISALRHGPMTVKNLERAYIKYSETSEMKSDKTIYRYLKTLIKAGVVATAGQRVTLGKTATETLFARTALVFYVHFAEDDKPDKGADKCGVIMADIAGEILSPLFDDKSVDSAKLGDLFSKFHKAQKRVISEFLPQSADRISEAVGEQEMTWKQLNYTLDIASYFGAFLLEPTLLDDVRACFK